MRYDYKLLKDIDDAIILHPAFAEWYKIAEKILKNEEFQKRKYFKHHHNLSVWDHSILVSFKAFLGAKFFLADPEICALAGLLHDFYPYAWLYSEELENIDNGKYLANIGVRKTLFKMHGFTHGKEASINYIKFFPELKNKKITNSIKNHMFPLTLVPPRYREGFIVTWIDKMNSMSELPSIKEMRHKVLAFIFK